MIIRLCIVALVCSVMWCSTGCSHKHQTARAAAAERWTVMRARVKAKLAADQLQAGFVEEAAKELADALRLSPDDPELLLMQARVSLAQGNHAAAARLLESLPPDAVSRGEVRYLLGIIAQQRMDWDAARIAFDEAAALEPTEAAYALAGVQVRLQQGAPEAALAQLARIEDAFGWTPSFHATKAECLEQLGRWAEASQAWRRVFAAESSPYARLRLAHALVRVQHWQEAVELFEVCLRTDESVTTRLALAECYLCLNQPRTARDELATILRTEPNNPVALRRLAWTLALLEDFPRALQTARRLARLRPNDLGTLELTAVLAFRAGEYRLARELASHLETNFPGAESPVPATLKTILARMRENARPVTAGPAEHGNPPG